MPSKKNDCKGSTRSGTSSKGNSGKKESKGGTAIKVRHILCEKQVVFPLLDPSFLLFFLGNSGTIDFL